MKRSSALVLTALLLAPCRAWGQAPPPPQTPAPGAEAGDAARDAARKEADDLKRRGNQAMLELNFTDAVDAYHRAIALDPDDTVLYYNLGRAYQAREDYPDALDALETFGKRATPELLARVPKLDALVADVRSKVGALAVSCSTDLPNARVLLGETQILAGCRQAATAVRISLRARNAPPHETVDLRLVSDAYSAAPIHAAVDGGGPPVSVRFAVIPRSTSGVLLVRASPTGAQIAVDGVARGNPPLELPLVAGAHEIDVRADHHDPRHVSILIEAGATKEVTLDLSPSAPITSKWWFWGGVVVGAAAIGVAVYVLAAQPERSAGSGSIPPGQVSAGLVHF